MTTTENAIAFHGVPGAYSELACRAVYPSEETLPCPSFEEAIKAVRKERARYAMLPVENSIAGRVADIHYLLPESGLVIVGEHYQRVVHHLLAVPGATLADIKTVRSHIQALTQCRNTIKALGLKPESWNDTASAAKDVAALGDKSIAAISSSLSGEIYGLTSLRGDLADEDGNTTRFLVMAREPIPPRLGTFCVTSLLFRVRSVPAALYKALGGFATCGVNLTKIESYLVGGHFDAAQFFVDVEGHPEERPLRMALDELNFFASEVRILGTYPGHPFRRQG